MTKTIQVETRERYVEVILNRPPVNAVSSEMYEELIAAFREIGKRTDVHAVILRAEGRMFCAGADIREPAAADGPAETGTQLRQRLARTCYETILQCPLPTIAVLHGATLGAGAALGATCDIRFAADDLQLGLPEIKAGRCGGGAHLMRLIPQGQVRQLYFTGDPIDAPEAYRIGLVQYVGSLDDVVDEAREQAHRMAQSSPLGLRLAKQALNEAEKHDVFTGYRAEQEYTLRLAAHPDAAEAATAQLDKREPQWSWPAVKEAGLF